MPRLSVEGVACLTAVLPPIMRLAELPPEQLQAALDALLHSGRTLMLQVGSAPAPTAPWGGLTVRSPRLGVLPQPLAIQHQAIPCHS